MSPPNAPITGQAAVLAHAQRAVRPSALTSGRPYRHAGVHRLPLIAGDESDRFIVRGERAFHWGGGGSIDDAVKYALAPRWAVMGGLMTLALAGGEGGMAQVMTSFAPAIEQWWADLGQPRLTAEVQKRLIAAADELAEGRPIADWIRTRDEQLVKLFTAVG